MINSAPIKLRIPEQDLEDFSLFDLTADAAILWARSLRVANTKAVVQQLRQAIEDLNRLVISPDVRFGIMEALRPGLHIGLAALTKRFLNQPLVLPEEPKQMSELASTLYRLATTAYTIVALQAINQRDSLQNVNPARLVCESLQRAVGFAGRKILQSYQLYQPIESQGWLELHQLYALAERQQLADLLVSDNLHGDSTIKNAYLRAIMLSCCKPNQLRQTDLAGIFRGLLDWSGSISLGREDSALFQVNLGRDQAPIYSALISAASGPNYRSIDTSEFLKRLESLKNTDDHTRLVFDKDTSLSANMLDHLTDSLGTMSKRNFARDSSESTLWITLGLTNAHYFIAGGLTLDQLIYGAQNDENEQSKSNPFMEPVKKQDSWEQVNPHANSDRDNDNYHVEEVFVDATTMANLEHRKPELSARERHQAFAVKMIDASPGGYCVEWSKELPGDIKAGDIVSIRDYENAEWVVAVTRWVSQLQNARTLVGVELLSPKAMPYGAKVLQTTGQEIEPIRVLLLPEIKLVGQPHTLITPRVGLKERQKVSLIREGEQFYVQLVRQVAATSSYVQFDFRYIKLLEDVIAEDKAGPLSAAYDSLWTNI
jgi:hypothetical protein